MDGPSLLPQNRNYLAGPPTAPFARCWIAARYSPLCRKGIGFTALPSTRTS